MVKIKKIEASLFELEAFIENKNTGLLIAINTLSRFVEPCGKDCCLESKPPYHWRGCEVNINPIIEELRSIRKI